MTSEEIERGMKLEAAATPGPVTASADTTNPDEPVDRIYDSRGKLLAQLWPEEGMIGGFEKAQADGRLYAYLRNHASALLSAAATLAKVREAMKGVETEHLRIAGRRLMEAPYPASSQCVLSAADAIAKVQEILNESERAQ